jgi:glycosyltransferase involved in cell wall biosynthesis
MKRPETILVLNYEYPPLGGGAGNATHFLCREWSKMDLGIDVVTTWFPGLDEIEKTSDRTTIYRVRSRRKRMEQSNPLEMLDYMVRGYRKARDLCRRRSYDLTVSFFALPSGWIAYRLFRRAKLPYIVLLRGGDVPGFLPDQLALFHRWTLPLTDRIWKGAGRIIANSAGLRALAMETGRRLGISVDMVPNGVDADFFQPGDRRNHGKPFTFLFVGRFIVQKRLLSLIEQFEKHIAPHGAVLALVGDGPEKGSLVNRIRSSRLLSSTVTLHPWSDKEALLAFYQNAHCLVHPSSQEGLPNTLLEAMACGLPVIASNIGWQQ